MTASELGLPAVRRSAPRDPARPADPRLVDTFGRVATDLRISLTDRCNLRCSYCMPAEGLDWMPRAEQLTDDELVRLIGDRGASTWASRSCGFTGGEPLLRRGLEGVIAAAAALTPAPGHLVDHQRDRAGPARRVAGRGRGGPAQRLDGHAAPGPVRHHHPPRPAGRRAGRAGRRPRRRPGPDQDQHRAAARGQRRRGGAAAAVRRRARLRAAVHRADAAGRPARLGAHRDGHRRRDPAGAAAGLRRSPRTRPSAAARRPSAGWSTAARPWSA